MVTAVDLPWMLISLLTSAVIFVKYVSLAMDVLGAVRQVGALSSSRSTRLLSAASILPHGSARHNPHGRDWRHVSHHQCCSGLEDQPQLHSDWLRCGQRGNCHGGLRVGRSADAECLLPLLPRR